MLLDWIRSELTYTGLLGLPFLLAAAVPMTFVSNLPRATGGCDWCGRRPKPGDERCSTCGRKSGALRWTGVIRLGMLAAGSWALAGVLCFESVAFAAARVLVGTAYVAHPFGPIVFLAVPIVVAAVAALLATVVVARIARHQTNNRAGIRRAYYGLVGFTMLGAFVAVRVWFGWVMSA